MPKGEPQPGCSCFCHFGSSEKKRPSSPPMPVIQARAVSNGHVAPPAPAGASAVPKSPQHPTLAPSQHTKPPGPTATAAAPIVAATALPLLAGTDPLGHHIRDDGDLPALGHGAALSASSAASSSAYYSAGGWSHFGENGEWLGPPGERTASAGSGCLDPGGFLLPPPPSAAAMVAAGRHGVQHQRGQEEGLGLSEPEAVGQGPPVAQGGDHHNHHHHLHQHHSHGVRTPDGGATQTAAPSSLATAAARVPGAPTEAEAASGEARPASAAVAAEAAAGAGSPASLADVVDRVADLYGCRGQPCKACQLLLTYCRSAGVRPESLRPELVARQVPDVEGLTKVAQGISESLADISSDEGWQVVRNDELRLLYRHLPGPGVHAFRARCILDAPTEHLMAITREIDLCPTWLNYCTSAAVLKESSLTDVMVYMSLWVPWPFNSVGFALEATGADLLDEEGWLHVAFSSPDKEALAGVQLPPGSEKHRRMRILSPSCLSLKPLPPVAPGGPPRTLCRMQAYVDPGTRAVPSFIISFVLKVLSPFVYAAAKKTLASAFKSPDSPMPTRMRDRPELYDLVRRRSRAFLEARGQGEGQEGQEGQGASLGPEAEAAMAVAAAAWRKKNGSRRARA